MNITYSDHTVPTFTNDNYSYYTINTSDLEPNQIYYAANTNINDIIFKPYQEKEKGLLYPDPAGSTQCPGKGGRN